MFYIELFMFIDHGMFERNKKIGKIELLRNLQKF